MFMYQKKRKKKVRFNSSKIPSTLSAGRTNSGVSYTMGRAWRERIGDQLEDLMKVLANAGGMKFDLADDGRFIHLRFDLDVIKSYNLHWSTAGKHVTDILLKVLFRDLKPEIQKQAFKEWRKLRGYSNWATILFAIHRTGMSNQVHMRNMENEPFGMEVDLTLSSVQVHDLLSDPTGWLDNFGEHIRSVRKIIKV